jgi:hypothetical protein
VDPQARRRATELDVNARNVAVGLIRVARVVKAKALVRFAGSVGGRNHSIVAKAIARLEAAGR